MITLIRNFLLFGTLISLTPSAAFVLQLDLKCSDITSGPKTDLGDGKGSGAIVTIWGNNLGKIGQDDIELIEELRKNTRTGRTALREGWRLL